MAQAAGTAHLATRAPRRALLAALEREMALAGRAGEHAALCEARQALGRPERGFLTTGRAAARLSVSIPTIQRWTERGALVGGQVGGRWLVSSESVERVLRLRSALLALAEEGNPTSEELRLLGPRRAHLPRDERGPGPDA